MLSRSAFSLIDSLMAVTVLAIFIGSLTALTFMSFRANQFNQNRLTAYYLAQEGVEAVRNMRDSNWLQNYEWDAQSVDDGLDSQLVGKPYVLKTGVYIIESNLGFPQDGNSPWKWDYFVDEESYLEALEGGDIAQIPTTRCELTVDTVLSCSDAVLEPSFNRYVLIDFQNDQMFLESVVFWFERGFKKEVKVAAGLSDWRKGPL